MYVFRDLSRCPNKVLCFTRSSQLVHLLPSQYPSAVVENQTSGDEEQILTQLTFDDPSVLVLCKLSSVLSQSAIQEFFNKLTESDTKKICLFVANVQDSSKQIINHIRIMIEEKESHFNTPKLFVFLLQFPPENFFQPCYPSLFLKHWDHYYLDTVAHSSTKGSIDIQDWFFQCCFPSKCLQKRDSLMDSLREMLPQAIPILISKVCFGTEGNAVLNFNCPMSESKRSVLLNEFLFNKGVGDVLCERFRSYWKPSVIAEYLEKAAMYSKNRESTLNIAESVGAVFKSLFFNFLAYMINLINEEYNIEILFSDSCIPAIQSLFLDILKVIPVPKLSEIPILVSNLSSPKPLRYIPQFPFFSLVYHIIEKLIDQNLKEINLRLDLLGEKGDNLYDEKRLQQAIKSHIEKLLEV